MFTSMVSKRHHFYKEFAKVLLNKQVTNFIQISPNYYVIMNSVMFMLSMS